MKDYVGLNFTWSFYQNIYSYLILQYNQCLKDRLQSLCIVIFFLLCMTATPILSYAAEQIDIDIPALSLPLALAKLAESARLKISYDPALLTTYQTNALKGNYEAGTALKHLLANSGWIAIETAPRHFTIVTKNHLNKPDDNTGQLAELLPEVQVTAPIVADSPYNTRYIRTNAISATRTDTPIMETASSIQVVPKQVLQDQQAFRLNTALQNVSGVTTFPNFVVGADSFMIRGFQTTSYYRNGVFIPTNNIVEMANIERMEVLKGPGSILFGRTDPGGIINIVTKQPLEIPYFSVQQQAGSFDFYRTAVDATGPVTKDNSLLYRLNLSYENSGSFRDFIDRKTVFFAPMVKWNISPQTQITAEMEYQTINTKQDGGIPSLGDRPAPVPRNINLGEPLFNSHKVDRNFFGVNWSHQFNADWSITHRLSTELTTIEPSRAVLPFGAAALDGTVDRYAVDTRKANTDRYQSSINLIGKITTGVAQHTLLFGYDYFYQRDDYVNDICCPSFPINIFNHSYMTTQPAIPPGIDFSSRYVSTESWHGAYFQDQIKLPFNLHIMGGFRYDSAVSRDILLGMTTGVDDRLSPRAGLLWRPMPWLSLYSSYTENFGVSNGFNSNRQRLPVQTAQQWEAGLKTEFFDGRLRSTLSYYDLTKQNISVPDPVNPLFSKAIGEAETRGIEFDVAGEILPGWNMIAAYSYMPFAKITKDTGYSGLPGDLGNQGNRLFLAPRHYGSVWNTYAFQNKEWHGFKLGAGLIGVGNRQGDAGNSFQLPGYVTANLMANYQFKVSASRMSAQLNVNNLFDRTYFAGTNGGNFISLGTPLTVMGSLRIEY
ncbi:MAG: iron complex outermembrane recepter protein [Candidatus Nitrotoga sp. SPKER]|nr:MAG: iron complex outermembrane recepter protein [Candidatus Nitrotoga sp. SPKER]